MLKLRTRDGMPVELVHFAYKGSNIRILDEMQRHTPEAIVACNTAEGRQLIPVAYLNLTSGLLLDLNASSSLTA